MFGFLDDVLKKRHTPKAYFRIPDDHVAGEERTARPIVPNECYVELRACRVQLRYEREYFATYKPLVIAVADFLYGAERRSAPFFVGEQILPDLKPYLEGEHVRFCNTRIAGPTPYLGDDFGLFLGLFGIKCDDLSQRLFGVVDGLVKTFDVTNLSKYLEIGKALSKGLSELLGLQDVKLLAGLRDTFRYSDRSGAQTFREGYLVCMSCPGKDVPRDEFWVREGELCRGDCAESARPFDEHDFCLVRIERHDQRHDYRSLTFWPLWQETEDLLRAKQPEKAAWQRTRALQELARSADLTEAHKEALVAYLEMRFQKLAARPPAHRAAAAREDTRREANAAVTEALRRAAGAAADARERRFRPVIDKAMDLSRQWADLPDLTDELDRGALDSEGINRHLTNVGRVMMRPDRQPDPQALADAITLAALRAE